MMSMNALRSMLSATARRISGLSNGGFVRDMMMLVASVAGPTSQIACGDWSLTSFSNGIDTSYGKVMSNLPATKARIAVDRLGMIVNSMPSRWGRPRNELWTEVGDGSWSHAGRVCTGLA